MPHDISLITTIVIGLGLAFLFGTVASRLRIPPLVGYLLAGVMVGPFTPGYVADQALAGQLAEIGVILLMFGVGLHFSLKDLLSVKAIAIPGAVAQIAVATVLGLALALTLGWSLGGGLVFGLALSVASTVVLLRALQERRQVDSDRGRIAVGWLIVEDLAMVLVLVLLPALASLMGGRADLGGADLAGWEHWLIAQIGGGLTGILLLTLGKVILFVALMLVVGRRVIPWLLHVVAHGGSRELFRLAVLAIALGVAFGAAKLFGVSFALGAFFAGMVLGESELSHRAAEEILPLRDAFAVLFFVSVGMLLDPASLLRDPLPIFITLIIIVIGKSLAAYAIVRAFRHPPMVALTIAASLAQIGEFSFILAELGIRLELLPSMARDLILAGAILSILINPLAFVLADRISRRWNLPISTRAADAPPPPKPVLEATQLENHVVLVGHGRVGGMIADGLRARAIPFLVIDERDSIIQSLRQQGIEALSGNAADEDVLAAANLAGAQKLMIAIPGPFEAGQVVAQARAANPDLSILVRADSMAEADHLTGLGANQAVSGQREIANRMLAALPAPTG